MGEVTDRYRDQLSREAEDLQGQIESLQSEIREREAAIESLSKQLDATVALAAHIEKGAP